MKWELLISVRDSDREFDGIFGFVKAKVDKCYGMLDSVEGKGLLEAQDQLNSMVEAAYRSSRNFSIDAKY